VSIGKLSSIQERVLATLAAIEPRWTLTGGGALAGFYTKHRETRDLDLFFRHLDALGDTVTKAVERLEQAGLAVTVLRTAARYAEIDVRADAETVVIDFVADPTPVAEEPADVRLATTTILVDTPHQLLVNKLCALLSRSEIRDLVDVRALLDAGGNLDRALADCPKQDAGFSPLTFSWSVKQFPIARVGPVKGLSADEIAALEAFRDDLVDRVVAGAKP
jgi:hypothetical protein